MNTNETTPIKFTAKSIFNSLPKGFDEVSIPKKTRTIYIHANTTIIKYEDAKKEISKLCKKLGLKIDRERVFDSDGVHFILIDPKFKKDMILTARNCLKLVKEFYTKYDCAYRYDDDACDIVRKIIGFVDNDY